MQSRMPTAYRIRLDLNVNVNPQNERIPMQQLFNEIDDMFEDKTSAAYHYVLYHFKHMATLLTDDYNVIKKWFTSNEKVRTLRERW